jgi:oxygen-dependent protoporphyrinogen oxidase
MVAMAYDPADIALSLEGAGVLVPKPEQQAITACSWGSSKWEHLAASGSTILRVSVGHIGNPEVARLPDDELLAEIRADLKRIMGIEAEPAEVRISRWLDAFPQYSPGHLAKVDSIEAALEECAPGLFVAGASYRGVGIPACIDQAHQAVRSTERYLQTQ